jgi:hypothetical protein
VRDEREPEEREDIETAILTSLEKISKETSRYQKAALLANIFHLLAIGLSALSLNKTGCSFIETPR